MAGLKLKSGADFCNFEAFRMRLHNAGEDPTSDFGVGQIYFNTSDTSVGSARHVRLYDGTKFRSLAYLDDVDSRIKTIEDMLSVDTAEGVVSTWNEIQAFLDSVQEGTDLMDLLNGKLDMTGGTINGNLAVSSGTISSLRTSTRRAVFYKNASESVDSGTYIVDVSDSGDAVLKLTYNDLTWKGNTVLTSAGGTLTGNITMGTNAIVFSDTASSNWANPRNSGLRILNSLGSAGANAPSSYGVGLSVSGAYGFQLALAHSPNGFDFKMRSTRNGVDTPYDWVSLLHSGNVGEYAMKVNPSNINLASDTNVAGYGQTADGWPVAGPALLLSNIDGRYAMMLNGRNGVLRFNTRENGTLSDWKTIAFTDSNVASAQALQTSGGVKFAEFAESTVYIGSETYQNYNTSILGKNVRLYSGNASLGLILNSSGNVIIGPSSSEQGRLKIVGADGATDIFYASDYTGNALFNIKGNGNVLIGTTTDTGAKLQVTGSTRIYRENDFRTYLDIVGEDVKINYNAYDTDGHCSHIFKSNNEPILLLYGANKSAIFYGNIEATGFISTKDRLEVYGSQPYIDFHYGNSTEDYTTRLIEQTKGTLKLVGNLHVTGNIIADGEVSAGGAGTEGGNAGGGGAFHSDIIKEGATQTTIAHGLGTDDIVVSIYEKDGVSGRWSIILTDVEIVDANNIIVSFGSATSVEHKVVIMGAVA